MQGPKDIKVNYYFDEAGDPQILGRHGVNLIDKGTSSKTFMVGYLECSNPKAVTKALTDLRETLKDDDYLSSIPSFHHSLEMFHANKDCAEVREKVFKLLKAQDITFYCIVARKNESLFREKFGFNGLIITDATQMVGFTCSMPRHLAVPTSIENGADMFLFTIDQREDVQYMIDGLRDGILSHERLDEACLRVLALKAMIHLDRKNPLKDESCLKDVKSEEHVAIAKDVADRSITLVKNKENLLPLSPAKTSKIKLIQITNERLPEDGILPDVKLFKELLEKEGFEVSYFKDGKYPDVGYSIAEFKKETDLFIYYANMKVGSNQTTIRITWDDFLGESSPKYVHDLPYLFLSFSNPYHLVDVPMVKTYINAYTSNEYHVRAKVEKLMGRSEFKGVSPVDPFAGLWDTRL